MAKRKNGEGSVRSVGDGYEAIVQSSLTNPKTNKPKRFKRKGSTPEEALANAKVACQNWELQMSYGKDEPIDKRKTLGSYMEEYLTSVVKNSGITASTYHTYYRTVHKMFMEYDISKLQLQMLNPKVFEDYYNELYRHYSVKSCGTPRQVLIKLCKTLCDKKLLPMNYAEIAQLGIKKEVIDEYTEEMDQIDRQRKRIWSNEDIQKFYQAYKTNTGGEIVIITLFLIETGIRIGEFIVLTNNDIDIEKRTVRIAKARSRRFKNIDIPEAGIEYYTKVTKNSEPRVVYLSDFALELVGIMMYQTKTKCKSNPDNLLYPQFRTGKQRTSSSLEICLKDLCDKLNIDRDVRPTKTGQRVGLSLHACRHTYDSIANTAKEANPIATALSMGHKAISVENVYTHMTENAQKNIKTASSEVLGIGTEPSSETGLTEDEEKMLYELLKKKFEK